MKTKIFKYGGKRFVPVRKFTKLDGGFSKIAHALIVNNDLGFQEVNYYGNQKFSYNYDEFQKASTEKDCDLFRCIETNKLYVPCRHELQEYDIELQK